MKVAGILLCLLPLLVGGFKCDDLSGTMCDPGDLTVVKRTMKAPRGMKLTYWVYESVRPNPDLLPVIMVHGGPAFTHDYLLPMKQLACSGRTVIFYDQVGCGESWVPPSNEVEKVAPWLLTEAYYVDELASLIQHLAYKKVHLFGNSWGGIVLQLFALSPGYKSVASMVLSSTLSDAQLYAAKQGELLHSTLPPYLQQYIKEIEKSGNYKDPNFEAVNMYLTGLWTVRTQPMPDCVKSSFERHNHEIYAQMQGESEFTIGGVLEFFNMTDQLHKIKVPTFVTRGKYDTMTAPVVQVLADKIPNAEFAEYDHSGHLTMVDDAKRYIRDVEDFFFRWDFHVASAKATEGGDEF